MKVFLFPVGALVLLLVAMIPANVLLKNGSAVQHSVDLTVVPALTLLCALCTLPLSVWWFWRYCGAIAAFTGSRLSRASAFGLAALLFVLGLGWVWPGVVQGYLNSQVLSTPKL